MLVDTILMVFVFRPLVVWGGALKLDFPTRGEKHFNIGYDATWGDDKDGENDWLSSALAQRLA